MLVCCDYAEQGFWQICDTRNFQRPQQNKDNHFFHSLTQHPQLRYLALQSVPEVLQPIYRCYMENLILDLCIKLF